MKINYKSDFKFIEKSDDIDLTTPFRFRYKTDNTREYVASFDGVNYENCRRLEDNSLLVIFDKHQLAAGELKVSRSYYLTDLDFNDHICNLVQDSTTEIELTHASQDNSDDITIEVYPNYQKGDPFTYDDFTPEQIASLKLPATEAAALASEAASEAAAQTAKSKEATAAAQSATENINNLNSEVTTAEQSRATAETSRATAETARAEAETERAAAETSREETFNEKIEQVDSAIQGIEAPKDGKKYVRSNGEWVVADAKIDLFIDLWNSAVRDYGTYNQNSGYFELNGFEFSYETALYHYNFANGSTGYRSGMFYRSFDSSLDIKTNIPAVATNSQIPLELFCYNCSRLEVFIWGSGYMPTLSNSFQNCTKLKTIIPSPLRFYLGGIHVGLNSLETFEFKSMRNNTSFPDSPNFSFSSIYYIIDNSNATSTITFTLHPTAAENARAAYLLNPVEGYATLDLWAASKNISIATA